MRLSFGDYDRVERGDRGRKVRAAQCLLKQRQDFGGQAERPVRQGYGEGGASLPA